MLVAPKTISFQNHNVFLITARNTITWCTHGLYTLNEITLNQNNVTKNQITWSQFKVVVNYRAWFHENSSKSNIVYKFLLNLWWHIVTCSIVVTLSLQHENCNQHNRCSKRDLILFMFNFNFNVRWLIFTLNSEPWIIAGCQWFNCHPHPKTL